MIDNEKVKSDITGAGSGRMEMMGIVSVNRNLYKDRIGEPVQILILWGLLKMFWES